jgi:hypothetical protein
LRLRLLWASRHGIPKSSLKQLPSLEALPNTPGGYRSNAAHRWAECWHLEHPEPNSLRPEFHQSDEETYELLNVSAPKCHQLHIPYHTMSQNFNPFVEGTRWLDVQQPEYVTLKWISFGVFSRDELFYWGKIDLNPMWKDLEKNNKKAPFI